MSQVRIPLAGLAYFGDTLASIAIEFATLGETTKEISGALGEPWQKADMVHASARFENSWYGKRGEILRRLENYAEAVTESLARWMGWDESLGMSVSTFLTTTEYPKNDAQRAAFSKRNQMQMEMQRQIERGEQYWPGSRQAAEAERRNQEFTDMWNGMTPEQRQDYMHENGIPFEQGKPNSVPGPSADGLDPRLITQERFDELWDAAATPGEKQDLLHHYGVPMHADDPNSVPPPSSAGLVPELQPQAPVVSGGPAPAPAPAPAPMSAPAPGAPAPAPVAPESAPAAPAPVAPAPAPSYDGGGAPQVPPSFSPGSGWGMDGASQVSQLLDSLSSRSAAAPAFESLPLGGSGELSQGFGGGSAEPTGGFSSSASPLLSAIDNIVATRDHVLNTGAALTSQLSSSVDLGIRTAVDSFLTSDVAAPFVDAADRVSDGLHEIGNGLRDAARAALGR